MDEAERGDQQRTTNRTAEHFIASAKSGEVGVFGSLLARYHQGHMKRDLFLSTVRLMFEDAPESVRKEGIEVLLVGSRILFAAKDDMHRAGERILAELADSPQQDVAEAATEALEALKGVEDARVENIVEHGNRGVEETEAIDKKYHADSA